MNHDDNSETFAVVAHCLALELDLPKKVEHVDSDGNKGMFFRVGEEVYTAVLSAVDGVRKVIFSHGMPDGVPVGTFDLNTDKYMSTSGREFHLPQKKPAASEISSGDDEWLRG